jgi:hypothetical protein
MKGSISRLSSPQPHFSVAAYSARLLDEGWIGDDFAFRIIATIAGNANLPDPFEHRREFIDLASRVAVLSYAPSTVVSIDCRCASTRNKCFDRPNRHRVPTVEKAG